jgi:coenzyme F420-0:L-glutamate ligase
MHLFSLKLPQIKENDPLLEIIINEIKAGDLSLKEGDVLVISEKVIAVSQGRVAELDKVDPISKKAKKLAKKYDMDERYVELILREADSILGGMEHVLLAEINNFLIANAGIDQSNAGIGKVVLLPKNIHDVAWTFWKRLKGVFNISNFGVLIADSRVQPLRKGTIGVALATAGLEPIEDCRGEPDLFGRPLEITMRAIADDLTSAAQFLLGEGNERTPVVIIRGAKVQFTKNPTLTTEMAPSKCLYMNIFSKYLLKKHKKVDFI